MNKKVRIKLIIETDYEVPENWNNETIDFCLTENLCVQNILSKLCLELEEDIEKGICRHCDNSKIEIIKDRTIQSPPIVGCISRKDAINAAKKVKYRN